MKSHKPLLQFTLILFAFVLAGCNFPKASTQNPDAVYTQAAQTAAAYPTYPSNTSEPTAIITQAPATSQAQPTSTQAGQPTIAPTTAPSATPTATVAPTTINCTNKADFISDVTFPDNTEVPLGQGFVKTWRLKNTGTCTWTNKYALVFVDGDQMGGASPAPLSGSVLPGTTVDLSISLKAPGTVGSYQGDWQLQDANGIRFGTGTDAKGSFFVLIKAVEGVSDLGLGSPTWSDNLDNADYWYLLDTSNTKFTQKDGKLIMKSIKPSSRDEWGISRIASMKDYYLQTTFIVGDTCSGLDKYGVIGRAATENEGYVFEFSCDGRFRLYTWDGEHYNALQEWKPTASIKAGAGQTNVMGLWMKGDNIRLYANGVKIAEFTDTKFDEGQFGLVIGSANTENFTVYVDKVEYWEFE